MDLHKKSPKNTKKRLRTFEIWFDIKKVLNRNKKTH